MRLDYIPYLRSALLDPLLARGAEAVPEVNGNAIRIFPVIRGDFLESPQSDNNIPILHVYKSRRYVCYFAFSESHLSVCVTATLQVVERLESYSLSREDLLDSMKDLQFTHADDPKLSGEQLRSIGFRYC